MPWNTGWYSTELPPHPLSPREMYFDNKRRLGSTLYTFTFTAFTSQIYSIEPQTHKNEPLHLTTIHPCNLRQNATYAINLRIETPFSTKEPTTSNSCLLYKGRGISNILESSFMDKTKGGYQLHHLLSPTKGGTAFEEDSPNGDSNDPERFGNNFISSEQSHDVLANFHSEWRVTSANSGSPPQVFRLGKNGRFGATNDKKLSSKESKRTSSKSHCPSGIGISVRPNFCFRSIEANLVVYLRLNISDDGELVNRCESLERPSSGNKSF